MSAATADRLRGLLAPVVAAAGLDLDSVDVTPAGRRTLVRVAVDKDGGVTLDDVAVVSKSVSDALDTSDAMGAEPYVLEVSSPGVDRPLTEPRHWRRSVGRLVKVDLVAGSGLLGRVEAADGEGVDLDVDGHDRRLEFSEIRTAKVEVEFNRSGAAVSGGSDEDDKDADIEGEEG